MTQDNTQDSALPAVDLNRGWGSYVANVQAGSDTPTDLTPAAQRGTITQSTPLTQNPAPAPMPASAPAPAALPVAAPTPRALTPMQKTSQALDEYQAILDRQAAQSSKTPWFQIAGALLNPGRTGSFGEAVGNASNVMAAHQNEQQKMQLPMAKMRLDLLRSKADIERQMGAQQAFTGLIGGQQPTPSTSTTTSTTAVAGPDLPHPADPKSPSNVTLVGADVHPNDAKTPRPLTMQDALNYAAAYPEDKERISLLTEAAKQGLPDYLIAQNGVVFDKKKGKYITDQQIPMQEQKPYMTPFGKFNMTAQEYENFNKAPEAAQIQILTKMFGTNERGAPKTLEDHEIEAAARKEIGTKQASADVTGAQTLLSNRKAGEAMLPVYERIQTILNQPGVRSQLGLFKKGDLADVVSSFLQGDHSEKSIAAMQAAVKRVGGTDDLINALNDIDGQRGVAEAEYLKSMPGNARVTDFRLRFAQSLHPSSQDDMYGAFQAKLNEFKNRAAWDVEQHDLYDKLNRERGVTYSQLNTQPEYKDAYKRHSGAYAEGRPTNEPVPSGTKQNAPSGSIAQRLTAEIARRQKNQTPQ
jgi:hypothetical protein